MADNSVCSKDNLSEDEANNDSDLEQWFEDKCEEVEDEKDCEASDEDDQYERELLGEDKLSDTNYDCSQSSVESRDTVSDENMDATFVPDTDLACSQASSSSMGSISSCVSSHDSTDDELREKSPCCNKRSLNSADCTDEEIFKKKKIDSESDSDAPVEHLRKRKLGCIIALPSSSSSSSQSS